MIASPSPPFRAPRFSAGKPDKRTELSAAIDARKHGETLMPYELTFWSKPYLRLTGKSASTHATATAAWESYQGLVASDETVEIREPGGREIGWQELKMLAEQESSMPRSS